MSEPDDFELLREKRQREVDLLSLELLSNAKQYKKYIEKNRPDELVRRTEETEKFMKYKTQIADLFLQFLDEYEEFGDISSSLSDIQRLFKKCVVKSIQHIEMKEYSEQTEEYNNVDDDMLFSHVYGKPKRGEYNKDTFSYWGAKITKHDDNEGLL
jgi:hypothetical protein